MCAAKQKAHLALDGLTVRSQNLSAWAFVRSCVVMTLYHIKKRFPRKRGATVETMEIRQTDKKSETVSVRIPAALAVELRALARADDVALGRTARAALIVGVRAIRALRGMQPTA